MSCGGLSYSEQFDELLLAPATPPLALQCLGRLPKPDPQACAADAGRAIPFSSVPAKPQVGKWVGPPSASDYVTVAVIVGLHLLCLAAPFTFSWRMLALTLALFCVIGCLGIDVSYHRQLTHHSFASPKWLEYLLAFIGSLGMEKSPAHWVRVHRFHHLNTDTAADPHSSYEGFWWAHAGWLAHSRLLAARAGGEWIVQDLLSQRFYRLLSAAYPLIAAGQYAALAWLGGWPAVVWGGAVRQVAMWHVTWLVNSACHVWGSRPYATGDLSTNCAWLALLTFGEAWHNNHHAFPYSARHGLDPGQPDVAWLVIRGLQALGLAWDIRLPSEEQKEKMRRRPDDAAGDGCKGAGAGLKAE